MGPGLDSGWSTLLALGRELQLMILLSLKTRLAVITDVDQPVLSALQQLRVAGVGNEIEQIRPKDSSPIA